MAALLLALFTFAPSAAWLNQTARRFFFHQRRMRAAGVCAMKLTLDLAPGQHLVCVGQVSEPKLKADQKTGEAKASINVVWMGGQQFSGVPVETFGQLREGQPVAVVGTLGLFDGKAYPKKSTVFVDGGQAGGSPAPAAASRAPAASAR